MAACGCPGCGGHKEWVEQQRLQHEANVADFEAWLAAGKPPMEQWREAKLHAADKAYADVAPAKVLQ